MRIRKPAGYLRAALAGDAMDAAHTVDESELPFEFMLNALRLVEGFPVALFAERTGLPITAIAAELDRVEAAGLLVRDHQHIRPTLKGQRFLNDLLEPFLPGHAVARPARTISISPRDTARPT